MLVHCRLFREPLHAKADYSWPRSCTRRFGHRTSVWHTLRSQETSSSAAPTLPGRRDPPNLSAANARSNCPTHPDAHHHLAISAPSSLVARRSTQRPSPVPDMPPTRQTPTPRVRLLHSLRAPIAVLLYFCLFDFTPVTMCSPFQALPCLQLASPFSFNPFPHVSDFNLSFSQVARL